MPYSTRLAAGLPNQTRNSGLAADPNRYAQRFVLIVFTAFFNPQHARSRQAIACLLRALQAVIQRSFHCCTSSFPYEYMLSYFVRSGDIIVFSEMGDFKCLVIIQNIQQQKIMVSVLFLVSLPSLTLALRYRRSNYIIVGKAAYACMIQLFCTLQHKAANQKSNSVIFA